MLPAMGSQSSSHRFMCVVLQKSVFGARLTAQQLGLGPGAESCRDCCVCRAPHLVAMHNKTRSQRDMSHAVLHATGPWLLRDAFKAFTGDAGELSVGYAGEHEVKGTRIMVYSLGQW